MWGFVLVVLKCKGKTVGCAAGYAVERRNINDAGSDHKENYSVSGTKSRTRVTVGRSVHQSVTKEESADDDNSSIPSAELDGSSFATDEVTVMSNSPAPSKRESRIRVAFLFFAVLSITCVPLLLVFTFAPLKSTSAKADAQVHKIRDVIGKVQNSVQTAASAANKSIDLVELFPQNVTVVCPLINSRTASAENGLDLESVLQRVQTYKASAARLERNLTAFGTTITKVSNAVDGFESVFNYTESYIWLVPGVLLGLCTLLSVTLFGVIVAWRQNSNLRLQRTMSYGIMPLFITITISCWIFAIVAGVTTATGSDVCMYGKNTKSPDLMISALLAESESSNSTYLYRFVQAYTNSCTGENPSEFLTPIASQLEQFIYTLWNQLSLVEATGRNNLVEACGSSNIDNFLSNVRDLATLLTSILKSVESTQSSLSCENINPMYVEVVHESICSDATSAVAWGFLFFLVIGVCTMCMVTLRAAWRHPVTETKVLDECEVAENMIVDEHEEYLAYISKYKHEWQEYNGFDGNNRTTSALGPEPEDVQRSELEGLDVTSFQGSHESPYNQGKLAERIFDPYQGSSDGDGRSYTSNISFPSFREPADLTEDELLLQKHSSLLLSILNHDSDDVEADLLPSTSLDNTFTMSAYSLPAAIPSGLSAAYSDASNNGDCAIDPTFTYGNEGDFVRSREVPRIVVSSRVPRRRALSNAEECDEEVETIHRVTVIPQKSRKTSMPYAKSTSFV